MSEKPTRDQKIPIDVWDPNKQNRNEVQRGSRKGEENLNKR